MIHADYYGRRGVVIDKEFRKVTVSNPGTFRIGIEEAIAGGISDARNGKFLQDIDIKHVIQYNNSNRTESSVRVR